MLYLFDTCACMSTSLSIPCIHIQMFSDTISRPITTKLKCLHSRHLLSTALLRLAIVSPPSFSRSHVTQTRNRNQTHAHTHHTYTHTHSHVNFLRSLSYLPPFKFFFQPCFSTSQHIMHDYVTYIYVRTLTHMYVCVCVSDVCLHIYTFVSETLYSNIYYVYVFIYT